RSVSNAQFRYTLQRLWNPKTQKGLLATLRQGRSVSLVADALEQGEEFFHEVEQACEELRREQKRKGGEQSAGRSWSELRIRNADLVNDTVTLPMQRVREEVGELIKASNDADMGSELAECNRRLTEL